MKVLAVVILSCTLAFVSATSNVAKTQAKKDSMFEEVVGGVGIAIIHVPTQVAILEVTRLLCSGSIIKDNVILSVAHCLVGRIAFLLHVRSGSSYYNFWGHVVGVASITIHPEYKNCRECHRYDIAYAVLLTPAVVPGIHAKVISLWGADASFSPGTVGNVAGWGAMRPNGSPSNALLTISVPVLSEEDCAISYGPDIASHNLCTGSTIIRRVALCPQDSGAGLIIDSKLAGLAAFGRHCGLINYPGGYTSIAVHRYWIFQRVGV